MKLEKTFSVNRDLRFEEERLRYPRMCEAMHYRDEKILQLNRYIEVLVAYKDGYGIGMVALLASIVSLLASAVAKVVRKVGK